MANPPGPKIPAPTQRETDLFIKYTKGYHFAETCAARVGWTKSRLDAILRYGRAGYPGFKEFVDALDEVMFSMADDLIAKIHNKAMRDMSTNDLKWLYERRFGWREKKLQEYYVQQEIASLEEKKEDGSQISEEDVAAAEARALSEAFEKADSDERH